MADNNGNGDQRVTNAVLANKLEHIDDKLSGIIEKFDKDHDKVISNCTNIENLRKRVDSWNIINSLGVVGATITAIILGNK